MASKREWRRRACAVMAAALDDPHFLINLQKTPADAERVDAVCAELMVEMHRRAGVNHYSEMSTVDAEEADIDDQQKGLGEG